MLVPAARVYLYTVAVASAGSDGLLVVRPDERRCDRLL
jgi:hypothetical protein